MGIKFDETEIVCQYIDNENSTDKETFHLYATGIFLREMTTTYDKKEKKWTVKF